MSTKIHESFLETAGEISATFQSALSTNGPVRLRRRDKQACLITTLGRAVTGQQLSTAASRTIWNRVTEKANDSDFQEYVAACDIEELRSCGLSQAKAKTLKALIEASAAGNLDEEYLSGLSQSERAAELTKIWGIGQWTADMMGMFYFGDRNIWPAGDVTVCNTLRRLIGGRRSLERTAERFAPHRSYLALYMYSIADAPPNS